MEAILTKPTTATTAADQRRQIQPPAPTDRAAVSIAGATKSYRDHAVLKGLNMTVPKGKIYGLLGPSGCGKTTLLSIMVGKSELDSGEITMDVTKREDIGYMPQDLNLHMNLTILQTFKFYGRMLNIDMNTIIERVKELETLLDLPPNNYMIEKLSGGQQRRVSMGVALLHNPKVLILDEPTVGLDPVLSKNIWNHLVSFAETGKTIIITTHYIEEARQAHTIGMMRDGILVAEESPETLMTRCNTTTLEDAFLILSEKQENSSDTKVQMSKTSKKSHSKKSNTKINFDGGSFQKNRIYCLLLKNLWLFLQQKSFTIFLVLLPIAQTYFVNQAIGHDPKGLNIAVVNKEMQQKRLTECKPEYSTKCFFDNSQDDILSCAYVEIIKSKSLNILYYDEVDIALNAVRKNYAWGLVYFPNNYTSSMGVRFIEASKTSDADTESSTVQVWIDYSNHIIANMLKSDIHVGMQEYLSNELAKCNVSKKVGTIPVSFKKPIYGSKDTKFIHYSSASILCLCCFFLPVLFTMSLILMEKNEGMMERMMASGVQFSEVLVTTIIVQVIIHVVQLALSMYVNFIHFDNPYLGGHIITIVILILIGMEGMILGFLIGAVCNTFMVAACLGSGINIAFSFTCGLIWPLESAHFLIQFIGPLLPITAPIKALQAITIKGLSIDSAQVYMGFLSIFCWSSVMIIAIFIIGIFKKDLWILKK